MAGEIPITPRLKKVLQLATQEAEELHHSYVGTEHLVLGILREGDGVAGRLLSEAGMDVATARSRMLEILTRRDEN